MIEDGGAGQLLATMNCLRVNGQMIGHVLDARRLPRGLFRFFALGPGMHIPI
jgi:hypothetical protein